MIRALFTGLLLALASPALSASPFDGVWKADLAATKADPKSEFLLLKDGSYTCSACTPELRLAADGRAHPTPGRDRADAMSATILDDRTMRVASFKDGKKFAEFTRTLAPDGQIMTTVWQSQDAVTGRWKSTTSRMRRVGPAPPGSFAQSGYWVPIVESTGREIVLTLRISQGRLTMRDNDDAHYTAAFDSKPVAITGDPGATAALRWLDRRSFEESNTVRGRPTAINIYRLVDAKTLSIASRNVRSGYTDTYILRKQ